MTYKHYKPETPEVEVPALLFYLYSCYARSRLVYLLGVLNSPHRSPLFTERATAATWNNRDTKYPFNIAKLEVCAHLLIKIALSSITCEGRERAIDWRNIFILFYCCCCCLIFLPQLPAQFRFRNSFQNRGRTGSIYFAGRSIPVKLLHWLCAS